MIKINWKTCTEEQLWDYIGHYFSKYNIKMVLVGGAVVSIYTDGAYRSGDLDFCSLNYMDYDIPKILYEVGFIRLSLIHI